MANQDLIESIKRDYLPQAPLDPSMQFKLDQQRKTQDTIRGIQTFGAYVAPVSGEFLAAKETKRLIEEPAFRVETGPTEGSGRVVPNFRPNEQGLQIGLEALGALPVLGLGVRGAKKLAGKADEVSDLVKGIVRDYVDAPAKSISRPTQALDIVGPTEAGQISTRFPTAVRATENPLNHDLIVGSGSSRLDPAGFKHNVSLISKYENFKPIRSRSPEAKAEAFVEHARENLNFLYDQVPPEIRTRSKQWYEGASRIAGEASEKYGVSKESAAGVYAALSPQKDWFMNVSLGDRVMEIYKQKGDVPWDKLSDAKLTELGSRIKNPAHQFAINSIRGKRLSELTDPVEKALWIRIFDESHNNRSFNIITPEGGREGLVTTAAGNPATTAWGSLNEISSAVSVLDDPSLANISRRMGTQHKVRNFYNNIFAPNSPRGDVTIDTHAVAADLLQPLAGKDEAVLHNFGSGVKGSRGPANSAITGNQGTYGLHAEAYRRAAADQGVLPREMQSITWEAVRGLFNNKSPKSKALAKSIWKAYNKGEISQQKAQELILDASGGINAPAWHR